MTEDLTKTSKNTPALKQEAPIVPTPNEIGMLGLTERVGFWVTHWMNLGVAKRLMTFGQRHIGSLWIYLATYNLMNVFGIENVENTDVDTPLVLVANHRSFFDMYTVSSVLFRRIKRPMELYFPVRGKFFYDNPLGWFVNLVMGWFSMFPPFFREAREARKREFDKFSMRRLVQLCAEGRGHIIGFHPEGKRNFSDDPYSILPAQPGIGKVIYSAHPQVIPVFIAGLGNDLPKQIMGNWTGGPKIRIWFGEPMELQEYYDKGDRLRTHKELSDHLMAKIAELGEKDRERFATDSVEPSSSWFR